MGEIGRLTFIRRLGVECLNFDFNRFIFDDLATLHKNLVNVGPVTPEFKRGKDEHPRRSAIWLCPLRGATAARPCGISRPTEFLWAISTQFCFSYLLGDVTALPRGLHASSAAHF